MKRAVPTPSVFNNRAVSSNCTASEMRPATVLKVPKNMVSSSVSGMESLAMALNCQPATVVASAENSTSHAMARR